MIEAHQRCASFAPFGERVGTWRVFKGFYRFLIAEPPSESDTGASEEPLKPGAQRAARCSRRIEEIGLLPVIKLRDNEPFEAAMRRFKKQCEKAGILSELKRREYYDKPSIRKKKKAAAARKRALKKQRRMAR